MAEKYHIQKVIPTGKKEIMFGKPTEEFHVKFAENEGTFKLWYQKPPVEGQEQWGVIDGWKFKKEKAPEPPQTSTDSGEFVPRKTRSVLDKERSDGMRQGMCINNAAEYVKQIEKLDPKEWAATVHAYAQELYLVSDLYHEAPQDVVQQVSIDEAPANIKEILG